MTLRSSSPPRTAPSGKTVVAGFADGVVRHLAVGSAAGTSSDAYLVSAGVPVTAIAFASGGDAAILAGTASGAIVCSKIGSPTSTQAVSACPAAGSPVICLRQSADGKGTWLATCANGLVRVFTHDTHTGSSALIHQDIVQNEAPIFADFSPSEPNILVCGGPGLGNGIYFYDFNLKRVSVPPVCVPPPVLTGGALPSALFSPPCTTPHSSVPGTPLRGPAPHSQAIGSSLLPPRPLQTAV